MDVGTKRGRPKGNRGDPKPQRVSKRGRPKKRGAEENGTSVMHPPFTFSLLTLSMLRTAMFASRNGCRRRIWRRRPLYGGGFAPSGWDRVVGISQCVFFVHPQLHDIELIFFSSKVHQTDSPHLYRALWYQRVHCLCLHMCPKHQLVFPCFFFTLNLKSTANFYLGLIPAQGGLDASNGPPPASPQLQNLRKAAKQSRTCKPIFCIVTLILI